MEVINNLKDDTMYELFFNNPIKSNLNDGFRSLINDNVFEETKKILQ